MASSSSNNVNEIKEVTSSHIMSTEFKIFVNNRITQDKRCLIRYVEERNELRKKVEASQDPISTSEPQSLLKKKTRAIIGCMVETQKRDRNRINLLTALINDIIDGIREMEGQAKLMEIQEQASSDED
ncbi:hypothetical protein CTI12_AA317440 [Artemisia annua]|uniref:Uncharacterized protein n=1 Tax=Artemisia annua TaxID=35608 RepID=A0A2U1N067_ARTAN|nr:hypothetical protein CTI12_AA450460 [Artemisia annua]PWA66899.1 hypothetical protein CTI12_AA317440 [Artemisia annua]